MAIKVTAGGHDNGGINFPLNVANYMAWAHPQYSRKEVNIAASCLIADSPGNQLSDEMLEVINNWRSSHSFPLNSFQVTLHGRAKKIDEKAVVAQRLKRLSSIDAKLRRFPEMKLSQMQDIGGCRAIVRNMLRVRRLVELYKMGTAKNPKERHEFIKEVDYIKEPKDDGYRSVHLIYRYRSKSLKHRVYNDLKIEIQLRSRLQHAWATAVETVSAFTGQALKSSGGQKDWRRFFALMSSAIALREKGALVPGTPEDKSQLKKELKRYTKELNVVAVLAGWRFALKRLPAKNATDAKAFLLFLDTDKNTISITGFNKLALLTASEKYLELEKTIVSAQSNKQAVLVSVDSLQAVRSAYPNYFSDTIVFIKALQKAIS